MEHFQHNRRNFLEPSLLRAVRNFASRQAGKQFRCLPLTVVPRVCQIAVTAGCKTKNLIFFSLKVKIRKHKFRSLWHNIKVYLAEPFRLGMNFQEAAPSCLLFNLWTVFSGKPLSQFRFCLMLRRIAKFSKFSKKRYFFDFLAKTILARKARFWHQKLLEN